MSGSIHRRRFLGTTTATGLALGAWGRLAGAEGAASDRIVVAVMGVNGRGTGLARGFARLPGAEVGCVVDVDERAVAKAVAAVKELGRKPPRGMKDFRRALDDKSIDALVIAAPDHWHAPATILACAAGKHVYVEKPLSHNPREGELMVEAARKHRRVVQMGNQRRSWEKHIEAMAQLESGVIGRTYYARTGYANKRGSIGHGRKAAVPSWLDFDLWQGPAPRREYRDNVVHYNWHWFWHWGTGEVGNNGVHMIDLCRWGLGVDYPVRVASSGGRYRFDDDQETPDTNVVAFDFADRKSILWDGLSCSTHGFGGTSFHGENGTLVLNDSGYTVYDMDRKVVRRETENRDDQQHYGNFADCIRSGGRPRSDVEGGHKSTLLCHLANIAYRSRRSLRCDPENGRILDDPEALELWGREYDKSWEPQV